MTVEAARNGWVIVNTLILLAFVGLAFIVPVWIYRKVNSIETYLKELNQKFDNLIRNDNQSENSKV